ncbi:MAG: glycosyltransferase [Ignavibacteriaceae bacterium]|nr:glycosyltransferase [Ignavibacteriaceae bacterium]
MYEFILSAYLTVNGIFLFYLCFPFINTLLGFFLREKPVAGTVSEADFGIIITSYKDIKITLPLIKSVLNQDYGNYHIYLVADHCEPDSGFIKDERLTVIYPQPYLNSKVKSIITGLESYIRPHEYTLIFDPDNLAVPGLLSIFNRYCSAGYKAVQGRRAAKNLDSRYASLDALGEHYYNHTQRYVPFLLGSSAPIAGSGMVIETSLYRSILDEIEAENVDGKVIVAEDKMLQNKIVERGLRIAYARNAIVYDEKIETGQQLERQRTRWLNSYFKHFVESLKLILSGLFKFDWNRFYFGLIVSIPPMVVLLLGGVLFLTVNIFISVPFLIATFAAGFLFSLNFLLVLIAVKAEKEIWNALFGLPAFVFNQVLALLKIKKANTDFLVTTKSKVVSIEDVMAGREKDNDGK